MNPPSTPDTPPVPAPLPAPPARRRPRWVGTLVALTLVGLVGAGAWYMVHRSTADSTAGSPRGPGGGRPLVTVGDAVARQMDVPITLEALGTVTPVSTVTVRPQVSGVLAQVLFTEGQMVRKGQLLAQIDARPFEQALLQAQGVRQRDEAQLQNARLTLERYRTLLAQDSIARQEVDTQAALVQQLEGTVKTDRAQEATAQLNLSHTRLEAPASGRIGLRTVDAGNLVSTSDAAGIATITQLAPIDVQFAIPQDRVADVRAAQADREALPVTALDRTRSTELGIGRFLTLDNQVDTATGTVRAKARFDNASGALFPNQFVNVQLLLRKLPAIVVPVTAVRSGSAGDYVYVINEDRTVSQRKVRRGPATVGQVTIAEGLAAGERVVTEGGDRLQDGMAVQLPGTRGPRSGASAPRGGASGPRSGASGPRPGASGDGPGRPRPPQGS